MTTALTVTGMSCQHCVRAVQAALESVPGVTEVEVDLTDATARVEGDTALTDLIHAIREAGYHAEPIAPG